MVAASADAHRDHGQPCPAAGFAAEPKWDGFRAQLAVHERGRVLLRSRQGTDTTGSFPEIRAAALAQMPPDTGLDGELVVWETVGAGSLEGAVAESEVRRSPSSFQYTKQHPLTGRRVDAHTMRIPLRSFFFTPPGD